MIRKEVPSFAKDAKKVRPLPLAAPTTPWGTIYLRMDTPQEKIMKKGKKRLYIPDATEQYQVQNGKVGVKSLPLSCDLTVL